MLPRVPLGLPSKFPKLEFTKQNLLKPKLVWNGFNKCLYEIQRPPPWWGGCAVCHSLRATLWETYLVPVLDMCREWEDQRERTWKT